MINALFVCIGNSCRSQMAEGFARKYGSDVMRSWSAGVAPAPIVQPLTIEVMSRKNIDIRDQFPKSIFELEPSSFDIIFNMSQVALPMPVSAEVRDWEVDDPMGFPEEDYVRVCDQIEGLVMQYVLELRRGIRKEPAIPTRPARTSTRNSEAVPAKPSVTAGMPPQSPQRYGFGRVRKAKD